MVEPSVSSSRISICAPQRITRPCEGRSPAVGPRLLRSGGAPASAERDRGVNQQLCRWRAAGASRSPSSLTLSSGARSGSADRRRRWNALHIHVGHAHTDRFSLTRGAPLAVLAWGMPRVLDGVGVDNARDGDRDPLLAWTVAVARLGAARQLNAMVSRLVYALGDRVDEDVLVDRSRVCG
jgi:hypothetical protein